MTFRTCGVVAGEQRPTAQPVAAGKLREGLGNCEFVGPWLGGKPRLQKPAEHKRPWPRVLVGVPGNFNSWHLITGGQDKMNRDRLMLLRSDRKVGDKYITSMLAWYSF